MIAESANETDHAHPSVLAGLSVNCNDLVHCRSRNMSATTALLLQLIVILTVARLCGWLLRHLGQPSVVGEMAAGLLLGPVVMGALFPQLHAQIFAQGSLAGLTSLSTLGLVLFMFVVGLELRAHRSVRQQIKAAGYTGLFSVLAPLALGLAISPALHPALAPAGVGFWPFALFIAAALSITAFPVMARILKDRGMAGTTFGQLSLSAAAVVDAFAWILLAVVVAMAAPRKVMSDFSRQASDSCCWLPSCSSR